MEIEIFILFCLVLFFASFVHTTIGFGLLLVSTPIFALFTDIQTAIIYLLFPTIAINIFSIYNSGNFLYAIKKYLPLAILTTIGTAIGTQLLINFQSDLFKILLALVIFFYLFSKKLHINYSWIKNKPKSSLLTFGIGSGLIGGLTNAIGPFLIIYTLESKYKKNELIQATNLCFLFGKFTQLILFSINDVLTYEQSLNSLFLTPVVLIGFYFGIKIKDKINEDNYRKIIKILLTFIALLLIYQSIV